MKKETKCALAFVGTDTIILSILLICFTDMSSQIIATIVVTSMISTISGYYTGYKRASEDAVQKRHMMDYICQIIKNKADD